MSNSREDTDQWDWHSVNTVEFRLKTSWSRTNHFATTYYEIAEASLVALLQAQEHPVPIPAHDEDPSDHIAYREGLLKAAIKTIVFSGMACEAAIYDLAAINLSDEYARNVLDKLDVIGKWQVVPRLVFGKSLNPKGPAMNALRMLVPARNRLVHPKSEEGFTDPTNEAQIKAMLEKERVEFGKILDSAGASFQALVLLSLELNRIFRRPAAILPTFELDEPFSFSSSNDPRIRRVITRCREIDKAASQK